jgi:copper transport protein
VVGRRRLFGVVLLCTFAALAPRAGAHAQLVDSRPADGSTLARAPHEIELRFNEAISPRFRVVRVIAANGHLVAGTRLRAAGDSHGLVVRVPRLVRGAYEVTWEVLAEADGHVTGGALGFGVGARPIAGVARTAGATAPPLETFWRWIDLVLEIALIGVLAMAALLTRIGRRAPAGALSAARKRLLSTAAATAGSGLAVGLVLPVRQADRLHATVAPSAGLGDVLGTRWGTLWSVRELMLAALLTTALLLRQRTTGPAGRLAPGGRVVLAEVGAGLLVVALTATRALSGHAAADPRPALAVAVATTHVLAAGGWIGGVAAFGLALTAAGREASALARACRATFARAAGLSFAALVVTGLVAAGERVASVDALLTTDYGQTLIVKCGLIAAAAALGLRNAWLLERGRRAGLLRLEVGFGLGVLMAAATLTASPPATGPEFAAPRPPSAPNLLSHQGDLLITATARPNRPGPNVLTLDAVSTRRPPPAPVDGVELELVRRGEPAQTVRLSRLAPGRFAGGADFDSDGRWAMTALIRRGGDRVSVPLTWAVDAPDPARPVTYSAQRLAPVLDRLAVILTIGLLAAAGLAAAARRRPRRPRSSSSAPITEPVVEEPR